MSIKDVFYKKEVVLEDQSKLTSSIESTDLMDEIRVKDRAFVPNVDFSDPSNFVRFGSAKEYYEGSIKRIYEQYPYDGSEAEKLKFYNDSTYLDQWLFDNKYPKSTGYAVFSADGWGTGTTLAHYGKSDSFEYIYSAGGLREAALYQHTGSDTIGGKSLKDNFSKGVVHDQNKNRTISYRMNMTEGLTVQFWLKKGEFLASDTEREVVLDLWNGELSSSTNYGRMLVELTASGQQESALRLTLYSGSYGVTDQAIALSTYGPSSLANNEWQHHTITVNAASQNLNVKYYNNGILNKSSQFSTSVTLGEVSKNINGYIGALQTTAYGWALYQAQDMKGYGKLSASMDDFRYWKKELDPQYIKRTWFYPIGGGSNSDDNRTSLGVYYKFNEGVVGSSAYDATVLDYSGRIANGTWTGYGSNSRNTGSAFVSASVLSAEPGDPIIRVDHPKVSLLTTEMQTSGSNYDRDNVSRMYDMVPDWLRNEDENDNINYLMQIMSSYFDTLYSQIKEIPSLKDKKYFSGDNEPYGFVDRLLEEKGMIVPNSFVSADVLNQFWQRDDHNNYYEQSIEKTKRLIYYNIYNNLDFILKSKGTEKSFRNLLRCFGIDDEVIKLNVYTDNGTHYIKDKYKNSSVKSKFVNFNKSSRFEASITQTTSSINARSYIYGSDSDNLEENNAITLEGDVIFPKKFKQDNPNYFATNFITSSLFGFHEADTSDASDYTFGGSNSANLQLYAVRDTEESENVNFLLTNAAGTVHLQSDFYPEVYDNERWNFSISVSPVGYPFAGSYIYNDPPGYNVELYGVTYNNETIKHEFTLSTIVSNAIGNAILTKPKRVYIGANKTNFTGSTQHSTDVKLGSVRLWLDKLDPEAIRQHNLDPKNYGHNKTFESPTVFSTEVSGTHYIPAMDTLALHWNFDDNSLSDASGQFVVEDFSSGSQSNLYGNISQLIEREHKGLGLGFPVSEQVFTNEFIFARRKELPEISFTDDRVIVMDDNTEFFILDEDTTDNVFSLEKSMNQSISEEMIRTFSMMKEYSNLFAKPVDYYRHEYKRLRKARSLFFERTTGNPDFEKFTEYFKWIDSSLSFFIEQLKPASVTFTDGVANVVESHIFERPKNARKWPTVKTLESTIGTIKGVEELTYNWKFGHSPEYKNAISDNIHCLWKRDRENRSTTERENIRKIATSKTSGFMKRLGDPANLVAGKQSAYIAEGHAEATRRFSKPLKLSVEAQSTIHGGTNYNLNKNRDFIFDSIKPHGTTNQFGVPVNVIVVGVGVGQGLINEAVCDDIENPNEMEKYQFRMTVGKDSSADGLSPSTSSLELVNEVKSAFGSPFNIISGSISDGANKQVDSNYKSNVILTNLHSDTTYMQNDVPLQGPFTETWVGGRQNRHVEINRYKSELASTNTNGLDDQYSRPEAYRLLFGEHPDETIQDGALGFVGPDYGGPYPDTTRKWAIYYRDLRGKRPYTIRNISGSQYRQGNYTRKYEYFSAVGRKENNSRFKKAASETAYEVAGTFLPAEIKAALPQTTNPLTLVGVATSVRGNTFGVGESNRINDTLETHFEGYYGSGSFQVTGGTHYRAPYSASITVEPIPLQGKHQSYHFVVPDSSGIINDGAVGLIHTGSFDIAPPVAAQHDFVSFKISSSSGLVNGDTLQITASSVQVSASIDTIGILPISATSSQAGNNIIINSYRKALGGFAIPDSDSNSNAVRSEDSGYSGLGNSSFTISFWSNNTKEDFSANNTDIELLDSSGNRAFFLEFDASGDSFATRIENTAGSEQVEAHDTAVTAGWNHYVVTVSASSGMSNSADVWKNGVKTNKVNLGGPGGTARTVAQLKIHFEDHTAWQDIVFWDTLLNHSQVTELYNSGVWRSPVIHTNNSDIVDWYKFGEEDDWKRLGLQVGNYINQYGPSTATISSSYGSGGNNLTVSGTPNNAFLVNGVGQLHTTEIWNQLTASLNAKFADCTTTYISSSTSAQFFLRKDAAGPNTTSITEDGTSFFDLASRQGAATVAGGLTSGDTISISGSTFTVRSTQSGSLSNQFTLGSTYRKSLHIRRFRQPGEGFDYPQGALYNHHYQTPTANSASISFWYRPEGDAYYMPQTLFEAFGSADGDATVRDRAIRILKSNRNLAVQTRGSENPGSVYLNNYSDFFPVQEREWHHYTFVFDKTNVFEKRIYKDGILAATSSVNDHLGQTPEAIRNLDRIYIGDEGASSSTLTDLSGTLQDFVIWNTNLTHEDAAILYNSGSWLDIRSHVSASSVWDWWMLGNEEGIPASGSGVFHGVPSIPPTIGRHELYMSASGVFITASDGIIETAKSTSDFCSHVASQIELVTNYTASVSSQTINLNATTSGGVITDNLSNTNQSFTNEAVFGPSATVYQYYTGPQNTDKIEIGDETFIISTGGSPSSYASSSGGISVNATGSGFFNYLTAAIEQYLPEYTASYFEHDDKARFFVRRGQNGTVSDSLLRETGVTFTNLNTVTGSTTTSLSALADGDSLTITDAVAPHTITIGHTISGSGNIHTAQTFRKALRFPAGTGNQSHLFNTASTNPTSDNISFSFWIDSDNINADSTKYLLHTQAGSDNSLFIYRYGTELYFRLYSGVNYRQYSSSVLAANEWQHYAVNIDTTDIETVPVLYKNGEAQSVAADVTVPGSGTGAMLDINKIYIGDYNADNALYEFEGSVQDVAVWNTGLNSYDAKALYNSGSWFDLRSHASASSIWDWWVLGNESGMPASGSTLLSANVLSIEPTVGRHKLLLGLHTPGNIYATDGIAETLKTDLAFFNEITQSIKSNTQLTGSYTTSVGAKLYLTASTTATSSAFSVAESGTTFNTIVAPFRGPDDLDSYLKGANEGDYIQFVADNAASTTTRFIVDANNTNAGGSFAKVGDHYYINPSGSSTLFWNRLTGALKTHVGATHYQVNITSSILTRETTITLASQDYSAAGYTLTESGTNYFNLFNISSSRGVFVETGLRNVTQRESDYLVDSTRNKTIITSRFSAPGGVEVQTYGYLDAYSREYSVHNNLNYRNLSIRGSGSGENGTIRVNSHANTRDGLRTLYQRPMGRGGVESTHGTVVEIDYSHIPSFHKIPRNTLVTPRSASSTIEIVERNNNYNFNSTIPSSDYNYSWVTSSLGNNYTVRSGTQKVFGYWPKDGLNKVNQIIDSAITFPSSSNIFGV